MNVNVYGGDHSPWVNAVLLALYDKGIEHSSSQIPPLKVFKKWGVLMPAVSIDGEDWEIESSQILAKLGYEPISREDLKAVQGAWQGVMHRADNPLRFLSSFARVGDRSVSLARRSAHNLLRSFVALYMLTLINLAKRTRKPIDPDNFGDQYVVWGEALDTSSGRFIDGESPGIRDLLLFGVVQCHASIPTPPLEALQHDERLTDMRQWIGCMQERFRGCSHSFPVRIRIQRRPRRHGHRRTIRRSGSDYIFRRDFRRPHRRHSRAWDT